MQHEPEPFHRQDCLPAIRCMGWRRFNMQHGVLKKFDTAFFCHTCIKPEIHNLKQHIMKYYFGAFLILLSVFAQAQKHTLKQLWQTDSIVAIPESVLPDAKSGMLYISLINVGPWDADGKGGIARLNSDGTGYDSSWITGLNAPKGMAISRNRLYVADISEVVVIDMANKKIEKKIVYVPTFFAKTVTAYQLD